MGPLLYALTGTTRATCDTVYTPPTSTPHTRKNQTMLLTLTAHWLRLLARRTRDPELAISLFEARWDIHDALARRRRG